MTKVYVVTGCTAGEYDAACDDPRSLVEGGMADFAAPQVHAVNRSAGLALETGIQAVMEMLREDDEDPETGEPYLPGTNPLDQARWVDEKGNPYDDNCPMVQQTYRSAGFGEGYAVLFGDLDKPYGRPTYEVYLKDPAPVRRTPYCDQEFLACVVVQELELEGGETK